MRNKEIDNLRMELYKLYSRKLGEEDAKVFKKMIRLCNYVQELKHTIKSIARIGGDHHL